MTAQITTQDYEQLSAYMDGQLSAADQHRLEERLQTHPEMQIALDELMRTRMLLRAAPRRRAPRNFTLTPGMVGQVSPRPVNKFFNLFPALSFASALAAFALIFSIAFQLLTNGQGMMLAAQPQADMAKEIEAREMAGENAAPMMAMEPQAEAMSTMDVEKSADSGGAGASPVILWGDPNSMAYEAYGKGSGGGDGTAAMPVQPPSGSNGQWVIPAPVAEAEDSTIIESAPAEKEGESSAQAAPEAAPQEAPQPDPSISGSGPILGVPTPAVAGQIISEEALQGLPTQQMADAPVEESAPNAANAPQLWILQVLLGLVAVITGAAAVYLRRSRTR